MIYNQQARRICNGWVLSMIVGILTWEQVRFYRSYELHTCRVVLAQPPSSISLRSPKLCQTADIVVITGVASQIGACDVINLCDNDTFYWGSFMSNLRMTGTIP
jgi:hypothetical protein